MHYHCWWWPSNTKSRSISNHIIGLAHLEYSSFTSNLNMVMMTSRHGSPFRVTGLFGEFIGYRWIPRVKCQWHGLWCFLSMLAWTNSWINRGVAGNLIRNYVNCDVIVISQFFPTFFSLNTRMVNDIYSGEHLFNKLGLLLLTCINFNPSMDKLSHGQ